MSLFLKQGKTHLFKKTRDVEDKPFTIMTTTNKCTEFPKKVMEFADLRIWICHLKFDHCYFESVKYFIRIDNLLTRRGIRRIRK